MKALLLDAVHKTATLSDIPIPQPGPNELLIAVKAIALNSVDALHTFVNPLGSTGRVIGSDFAGLVVARGPLLSSPDGLDYDDDYDYHYHPAVSATNGSSGGSSNAAAAARWRRRSSTTTTTTTTTSAASGPGTMIIHRGDRVAGCLQGACSVHDRPGAFAEYVVCPADLVWRVPAHLSLAAAASVSLCGLAAAQGLYFRWGLEAPFRWDDDSEEGILRRVRERERSRDNAGEGGGGGGGEEKEEKDGNEEAWSFLVNGASTSVGMYVAQLVRRSAETAGRRVTLIGLARPRHFERLKAEPYRYDHLIDHRDPDWPDKVRQASGGGDGGGGGGVHYAYDAISEASTVRDAISTLRKGGKVAVVQAKEAGAWDTAGVTTEPLYGAVWEGLGEDADYGTSVVRSSTAKRAFASAFYKWLSDGGLLHPNPIRVMPGGLEKVVKDGLKLLGTGVSSRNAGGGNGRQEEHMRPISGEKIVYLVETDRTGSAGQGHFE